MPQLIVTLSPSKKLQPLRLNKGKIISQRRFWGENGLVGEEDPDVGVVFLIG